MYSNNDFRYYKKKDNYLAHYGVKGMKWHKHLKAATDWFDTNVTGNTARKNMIEANDTYRMLVRTKSGSKSGREALGKKYTDSREKYSQSIRGKASNSLRKLGRNAKKNARQTVMYVPNKIKRKVYRLTHKTSTITPNMLLSKSRKTSPVEQKRPTASEAARKYGYTVAADRIDKKNKQTANYNAMPDSVKKQIEREKQNAKNNKKKYKNYSGGRNTWANYRAR